MHPWNYLIDNVQYIPDLRNVNFDKIVRLCIGILYLQFDIFNFFSFQDMVVFQSNGADVKFHEVNC